MSFFDPFTVAVPNQNIILLDISALTAAPSDVLSSETFFGKAGTQQTGTYVETPQLPVMTGRTRTIIKEIPDPVTEPALMAMAVLLIRNRQLKRKVKRLQTNG